jgi:hypothetical protein
MGRSPERLMRACGRLTGALFWLLLLAGQLPPAALLWLVGAALACSGLFRQFIADLASWPGAPARRDTCSCRAK